MLLSFLGTVTELKMIFGENLSDKQLSFDIEKLEEIRGDAESALTDLKALKTTLTNDLNTLRNDWNTKGGHYFFERIDTDWEVQVEKYENTLRIFIDVLNGIIHEFTPVEEYLDTIMLR